LPERAYDVPGVYRGFVPANAVGAIARIVPDAHFIPVPPLTAVHASWELALSRVFEWVPDFLTPYQKIGVPAVLSMPGGSGHLWWSAGCLTGDAELCVNRGGKAFRIRLDELVRKLEGGGSNGRAWDLTTPTMAQSIDADGFLRLNRIEQVHRNGIKPVFEVVTASGQRIKATAEHRFLQPNGAYVRLADLAAGSSVMIESWPTTSTRAHRKPRYREIPNMWRHPFVVQKTSRRKDRASFKRQAIVWEHRAVAEARENGISLAEFVGRIILGQLDGLKFLDPEKFHVHHVNGDSLDNRPSNLEVIERREHLAGHGREKHWRHVSGRVVPDAITSITPCGIEEVFDLSLADPMNNYVANGIAVHNSGKTLGAILWVLASRGRAVTVTKGAVKLQWADEIGRFQGAIRPTVLSGESAQPIGPETTWIVINYEILPAWIAEIERWAKGFQIAPSVVFDESHKAKSSKRWEATAKSDGGTKITMRTNVASSCMRLSKLAGRVLDTTATPVRDRPRDLWAPLDLAHRGAWGKYGEFGIRYCAATTNKYGGRDDTGKSNEIELAERLSYVVHRVKHSEANRNLPPKRRRVTYIPVDQQVKAVDVAKMLKEALGRGTTALLEARLMEAAARKRKWIVDRTEIACTENAKVIIFTGRKKDAEGLRDQIKTRLGDGILVLHGDGSDSPADREVTRQTYMDADGPCVLIGTTDAWGEGLNLHTTDLLLVGLLPYTPGQIIQLEGRVARLGQTRPVEIEYTVAEGTVDEHVAGILIRKLPVVEKMIESDEVRGLARELGGLDDPKLAEGLAAKLLGGLT
jgi:hypothetical protein